MPLLEIHTNPLRGIWKITEDPEQLLSLLERKDLYLPCLATITNKVRRQEWLAARLLLKELAGEELEICYQATGAPYLKESTYRISISHTKGYVAVMLTKGKYAGIDIEFRSGRVRRLKERVFSEYELNTLAEKDQDIQVLLYWSAKEVLFKMIGQEEVDFRKHLCIEPFTMEDSGVMTARECRTGKWTTFQLNYQVTPFYVWVWNNTSRTPIGV